MSGKLAGFLCAPGLSRARVAVLSVLGLTVFGCDGLFRQIYEEKLADARAQPPDPGDPRYLPQAFVNWESPHVSPLDITPDAKRLVAVNTAAARVEIFALVDDIPQWSAAVPVGLDPVSVRARTSDEAWVVNRISDSVSIVDLNTLQVTRTLTVGDEPADVAFAGGLAFVVCSQPHEVRVFDTAALDAPPRVLEIAGQQPRAAAVSPDGARVYVAIFESGNATTLLRDEIVSDPAGPYGGQNPAPKFEGVGSDRPPRRLPDAPSGGLIVRHDFATGAWLDDNGADWSAFVTWGVLDHDLAVIDVASLGVSYVRGLMNIDMQLAVRPDGVISVVGTEALNDVRFEPNVRGRFVSSTLALVDPLTLESALLDLNPHLDATQPVVEALPAEQRGAAIADPRAIVWSADGAVAYVAGLGSDNVAAINAAGERLGQRDVGAGPTGLRLSAAGHRLYVLNRFDASITTLTATSLEPIAVTPFFDPTPPEIKAGRPFLYNARLTSGAGATACAGCHVDARMDHLAWDLGDPHGETKAFNQECDNPIGADVSAVDCEDFRPLKGPMTTQTLQGIIGNEPFHWRGDRDNLAEFNPAFTNLNGNDRQLTDSEMAALQAFLATITFPPNPFREMNNSLPVDLNGANPRRGREIFMTQPIDEPDAELLQVLPPFGFFLADEGPILTCSRCHHLPAGTSNAITPAKLLSLRMSTKVPHLRNVYHKLGFFSLERADNHRGFGLTHDGGATGVEQFLHFDRFVFSPGEAGAQELSDVVAFVMAFSTDTHAGVGRQLTLAGPDHSSPGAAAWIDQALALAEARQVGLVVHGRHGGQARGYAYLGGGEFQSDRAAERLDGAHLRVAAAPGAELTWTIVPVGSETRLGIDRDLDGRLNGD